MKQSDFGREINTTDQWNRTDFSERDYKYGNLMYNEEDIENY